MLVLSEKTPMGRVLLLTSRNRRSMALVVLTALRKSGSVNWKQVSRSSRSFCKHATAFGYFSIHERAHLFAAVLASVRFSASLS